MNEWCNNKGLDYLEGRGGYVDYSLSLLSQPIYFFYSQVHHVLMWIFFKKPICLIWLFELNRYPLISLIFPWYLAHIIFISLALSCTLMIIVLIMICWWMSFNLNFPLGQPVTTSTVHAYCARCHKERRDHFVQYSHHQSWGGQGSCGSTSAWRSWMVAS